MGDLSSLFDEDTVEAISNLVEEKMPLLNTVPAFKEKDQTLATATEEFENTLSKDQKVKFDNVMKLHYQIDSYYFTLAWKMGRFSFPWKLGRFSFPKNKIVENGTVLFSKTK